MVKVLIKASVYHSLFTILKTTASIFVLFWVNSGSVKVSLCKIQSSQVMFVFDRSWCFCARSQKRWPVTSVWAGTKLFTVSEKKTCAELLFHTSTGSDTVVCSFPVCVLSCLRHQDNPAQCDLPSQRAQHLLPSQRGCISHVPQMEGQ